MNRLIALLGFCCPLAFAAEFNIEKFGATPNDETDDTAAIAAALAACEKAGGGVVFVPAGTFLVARQGVGGATLAGPANANVPGGRAASILKCATHATQFRQ